MCRTNFSLYVVTPRGNSDEYGSYSTAYFVSRGSSPPWSDERHSNITYIKYKGKRRTPDVKTIIEVKCPICDAEVKLKAKTP